MTTDETSTDDGAAAANSGETPVWVRDFPITSVGEETVTRRAFTRYLIAGSGAFAASTTAAAIWTWLRNLDEGEPMPIIGVDEVSPGGTHLFRYPGNDDPAILLRLETGELVAYSQKCTHLGCVVFYESESHELVCPCHEGMFEPATGDPIAGPPERPLPAIELEVRDNMIWATGIVR